MHTGKVKELLPLLPFMAGLLQLFRVRNKKESQTTNIRFISSLLVLLNLCVITSCNGSMKDQKFIWGGAVCAPKEYPVEIVEGALLADGYAYTFAPIYGVFNQGWGSYGKAMGSPDFENPLPNHLKMTWYSIQEQKHYTGSWPLDQKAMLAIWEKGYVNVQTGEKEKYDQLLIGLAPKGKVALWAVGDHQVLLGFFQAKETQINAENAPEDYARHFNPEYRAVAYDEEEMWSETELNALKESGWPDPEVYEQYNTRYPWSFETSNLEMKKNLFFFMETFNGEKEMETLKMAAENNSEKAIPQHIYACWIDAKEKKWVADFTFNYEDIKTVFEAFPKSEKTKIVFSIDSNSNEIKALLKGGNKQLEIPVLERTYVTFK